MRILARLALMATCWLPPAFAQEDGDQAAVSVRVLPAGPVLAGSAVTIEGMAPLDATGVVALTVKTPGGRQLPLSAKPAANGDYRVDFSATDAAGQYEVSVRSPGGLSSGRASFEVVIYDEVEVLDEAVRKAKQEAQAIGQALANIEADVDGQIAKLPDNPAKDELKTKWQAIKPRMQQAVRDFGEIDAVLAPLKTFTDRDPALKPLLRLPAQPLEDWTKRSAAERERIVGQLAASRRANVTCEQLERVIEGFKFAAALAKVLAEPLSLITDPLKDLATSVAPGIATHAASPVLKRLNLAPARFQKLTEVLVKVAEPLENTVRHMAGQAEGKKKTRQDLLSALNEGAGWLAGKVFDRYCERFSGPFDGNMFAEFFASKGGEKWWEYSIRFKGQLDLRYAKGSVTGAATMVNGEFTGQAVDFTLKEDAIRVGWPKLTAGAQLFKRAVVPQPWIFGAPRPEEPRGVEIDGKAAAVLVKPYSFMVPVQGEIVDDVLSLRIQNATHDYTASARVVYVIVSPLAATLGPRATAFELPYKEAGFFFLRVSKGEPVKLKIRRGAKSMSISDTIENRQGAGVAKGRYQLKLDLCNPAGAC